MENMMVNQYGFEIAHVQNPYGGFHKWGCPIAGWFIENPSINGGFELGVPLNQFGNLHFRLLWIPVRYVKSPKKNLAMFHYVQMISPWFTSESRFCFWIQTPHEKTDKIPMISPLYHDYIIVPWNFMKSSWTHCLNPIEIDGRIQQIQDSWRLRRSNKSQKTLW